MSWLARLQGVRESPGAHPNKPPLLIAADLIKPDIEAANDLGAWATAQAVAGQQNPDRWCWPHGTAMNTGEMDAFTARVSRFIAKGLSLASAERLADQLVNRDREGLDMGACLECWYCTGNRCTAPETAGLTATGQRAVDVHPIRDVLQRCPALQVMK